MKKRVLFIIDSLTCGGAEKSLVSLLPLLNREKYELSLWTRSPGGAFASLVPKHVHIINQPEYTIFEHLKFKLGGILYSIMFRWNKFIGKNEHASETLWKCQGWAMKVPEGNWDVVVAYQQGIPTYLVATKMSGCKRLAWINANIFNAGYNPTFNAKMYERMDGMCSVSEELHQILLQRYPQLSSKFTTIYDILNPKIIRRQAEEAIPEQDYNAKPCILTVGRLVPQKNHALAVEAAKVLRDRGVDFCWFFIGEGSERDNIEELIKKYRLEHYVVLLGLRTNPYAYMKRCDVYVQSSAFEGFGLTIAEAKILGKPVVSTNFDVVHDQLKHLRNGWISEMNPEALADGIMHLLNDHSLRKAIVSEVEKEENMTYITEVGKIEQLLDED